MSRDFKMIEVHLLLTEYANHFFDDSPVVFLLIL